MLTFTRYIHSLSLSNTVPTEAPKNIMAQRVDNDATMLRMSWDRISLYNARGFPTYLITYEEVLTTNNRKRQTAGEKVRDLAIMLAKTV